MLCILVMYFDMSLSVVLLCTDMRACSRPCMFWPSMVVTWVFVCFSHLWVFF